MSVSEAVRDPVNEIMDSMELATRNGFHLEPRCRCAETTWCARRSTRCWQQQPLRGNRACPLRRTMPNSTHEIGHPD
jgi:hypothetical protein